ncbi:MMPL family transporter [Microbacterium sp.]|jgi:RND superfamily putative drug exporter|uniref:MMPL family transporter n=1 Tax=Microbacterium sp. TaxID=51671 RepID=UPI0037C5A9A1
MKHFVSSLARACARHRWLTIAAWVVAVGALFTTAYIVGPALQDDLEVTGSDSQVAADLLEGDGGTEGDTAPTSRIVLAGADLRAQADVVDGVVEGLEAVTGETIGNPLDDPAAATRAGTLAEGGDALVLTVSGDPKEEGRAWQEDIDTALDPARDAGLEVAISAPLGTQLDRAGGVNSELVGVVAALIVLFFALGSALAALAPVATGIIAVAGGVGSVWLLSHGFTISESAVTLAIMIGLGVGIDYTLFLLSRFRSALSEGEDPVEAAATTGHTAGEAAMMAGITVAICALGLVISGVEFVAWLGYATAMVVLVAVAATLTLTPAVLAAIGHRALARRERRGTRAARSTDTEGAEPSATPQARRGAWERLAPRLTRHPVIAGLSAVIVLVVLSLPTLSLQFGQSSAGDALPGSNQRESFDLTAQYWGAGENAPLLLVAEGGEAQLPDWQRLAADVAAREDVAAVSPPVPRDGVVTMQVTPTTGPSEEETAALVAALRTEVIPASAVDAHIGGAVATRIDLSDRISERLPWLIGIVIAASMVLVAFTFRSILLPIKAALCNLLSIAAAFGVLVWVFQEGHGVELLGLDGPMPIDPYVPMMLFAVLFGLSMDYEVFLLTSMRQAWLRDRDARAATTRGLAETGGVISAAAIIMIAVFVSFTFDTNPVIKVFGVGLAAAVLVDATVIRLLFVPAVMTLLGRAAWWWPRGRRVPGDGYRRRLPQP